MYERQEFLVAHLGVRLYTSTMTTLMEQIVAGNGVNGSVVVDSTVQGNWDTLLEWVKASPAIKRIHVILPSRLHPEMRFYQNKFQSLGCTVTRKTATKHVSIP